MLLRWLLLGMLALPVLGEDLRTRMAAGNAHFEAGRFEEALQAYNDLGTPDYAPALLDLEHNRAATEFKLGRLDDARARWTRIASQGDAGFEAQARYNLGNVDFAAARQAAMQASAPPDESGAETPTPADPFALLDRSIANYRDALRLDRGLENARANLELAAQFKKQLQEQSEQQPQSQPSEDQQQQDGEQDEQQQDQQSSDQEQQENEQQEGEDGEQQEQDSSDSDQQQQQGDSQDQQDQQDQQQNGQQSDAEDEQDGEQQEQQQQDGENAEQQEQQPQQQQGQPQQAEPAKLSPEEIARMLQQIRDAEQKRREAVRAREAAKQQPVEKDW